MEVGQGPNWGCSAKEKEVSQVYRVTRPVFAGRSTVFPQVNGGGTSVAYKCWQKDFAFSAPLFLCVRLSVPAPAQVWNGNKR
jgi:hypothetical protein